MAATTNPTTFKNTSPDFSSLPVDTPLTPKLFLECLNSQDFENVFTRITEKLILPLVQRISNLENDLELAKNKIVAQDAKIVQLEKSATKNKQILDSLQERLDTQERSARLRNLRLTGVQGNSETIKTNFIEMATEKMNVQIKPEEVFVRVLPTTGFNKPVSALLSFSNVWSRNICYDRRMKLKGTGTFLAEDLSKSDALLFYKARQLKKKKLIFDTWTRLNRIYIRTERYEDSQLIRSVTEIEDIENGYETVDSEPSDASDEEEVPDTDNA